MSNTIDSQARPVSAPDALEAWLSRIYSVPKRDMCFELSRIKTVAQRLDCLTFSCPVVKIAGSNGKGTTAAMLCEIYQAAGFNVGLYTSPHLLRFNERIQINQQPISDTALCELFARIDDARGIIKLTFFEYATLAALLYFQQHAPDVLLLEMGLGGRLDAVNIVPGDCAVITTISLEHQHYLGETREAIATEKMGIVRDGIPLISGEREPPACIDALARACGSPVYQLGRDFFHCQENYWDWWTASKRYSDLPSNTLPRQNVATAMMVVDVMQSRLAVPLAALKQALARVQVPGRCQWLAAPFPALLDVAHNPESSAYLARVFANNCRTPGARWGIFSMLADKDCQATLRPWQGLLEHIVVATIADTRAADAAVLVRAVREVLPNVRLHTQPSIAQAFAFVGEQRQANDAVVAFGSFHVVAEILAAQPR